MLDLLYSRRTNSIESDGVEGTRFLADLTHHNLILNPHIQTTIDALFIVSVCIVVYRGGSSTEEIRSDQISSSEED